MVSFLARPWSLLIILPLAACQSADDDESSNVGAEVDVEHGLQSNALHTSGSPRVDHCIRPDGTDLNALFGVEDALVAPICREIKTGTQWTVPIMWFGARTFEAVPEGFEPAGATPRDDWQAKLVSVVYVVDAGTSQEKTFEFANGPKMWTGESNAYALANSVTLGSMPPLSAGSHTVDKYLRLNAFHCDGISADPTVSCVGPGLFYGGRISFAVVPQ